LIKGFEAQAIKVVRAGNLIRLNASESAQLFLSFIPHLARQTKRVHFNPLPARHYRSQPLSTAKQQKAHSLTHSYRPAAHKVQKLNLRSPHPAPSRVCRRSRALIGMGFEVEASSPWDHRIHFLNDFSARMNSF
jgi:hypothetical protein